MESGSGERSKKGWLAPWLLVAAALGALIVFGLRLSSWTTCWRLGIAEGRESPGIYAIWRLLHGHELYEWPTRPPYSLTLYNYGFYEVYAAFARALGLDGSALLGLPRLLTLAGAVVGAVLFVRVGARLGRPQGALDWGALASLAVVVWLGTQFIAWWVISIRPDLWAAALALGGLFLLLRGGERRRVASLVAASATFFAAWTFKQSCIWTFAGVCAGLLALGRRRHAFFLALPWTVGVALSLGFGSEAYRFNLLQAPAASAWRFSLFTENLSRGLPQNPWVFGFFALAFVGAGQGRLGRYFRDLPEPERLVIGAALVANVFGALALGREGSNKNHLFEGYVLSALASWAALQRASASVGPRWLAPAAVLLLVPLVAMPLVQLSGRAGTGRVTFCGPAEARELEHLNAAVARLPKPLYSDDEVFALPWHSTNDRYPALVLDGTWFGIAERERLVAAPFVQGLLRSGELKSALFPEGHPELAALRARGAACAPLDGAPFGLHFVGCRLDGPAP